MRDALAAQAKRAVERLPAANRCMSRKMNNTAMLLQSHHRLEEAEALFLEMVDGRRRVAEKTAAGPAGSWEYQNAVTNYALLLREKGELTKAEALFREVIASKDRISEHTAIPLAAMAALGSVLQSQGRLEEAEKWTFQTLAAQRA